VRPYLKSKTLAERAAWDFIANDGGDLELAVVNPVGVFGPVLGPDYSTSILVV
jgi:nucleoside-diphosphate-sugar epimerase